jgi:hypothetical protein
MHVRIVVEKQFASPLQSLRKTFLTESVKIDLRKRIEKQNND